MSRREGGKRKERKKERSEREGRRESVEEGRVTWRV